MARALSGSGSMMMRSWPRRAAFRQMHGSPKTLSPARQQPFFAQRYVHPDCLRRKQRHPGSASSHSVPNTSPSRQLWMYRLAHRPAGSDRAGRVATFDHVPDIAKLHGRIAPPLPGMRRFQPAAQQWQVFRAHGPECDCAVLMQAATCPSACRAAAAARRSCGCCASQRTTPE